MLNGINPNLTGEVLKVLCDMGHGDVIILADSNFPGETISKYTTYGKLIRLPGITTSELYKAISDLFPVDVDYTENPVCVMDLTDGDKEKGMKEPEIWADFNSVLHEKHSSAELGLIERFDFYEKAKKSFAIIQTGENRQYGNLLLVKGCVL